MSEETKVNRENTGQRKVETPEKSQNIQHPQEILHQSMALIFLVDFVYYFSQSSDRNFVGFAVHTRSTEARIQYCKSI